MPEILEITDYAQSYPTLADHVRIRHEPDNVTLVVAPRANVLLNPTATTFLNSFNGEKSILEIATAISKTFPEQDQTRIADDIAKTAISLASIGAIVLNTKEV
ncbi:MAG: PqqD family peptide modification chaperone [Corynebacterium sp.]|nr:PqqD family peptide modification chaperone [Corynebacterium sp.]